MAIAFVAAGTAHTASTSASTTVDYPAGISAGNLLVLQVTARYDTATLTTPSGWTLRGSITGGNGTNGVDSGTAEVWFLTKEADGTESGSLSLTLGTVNVQVRRMYAYSKAGGTSWDVAFASGAQSSVSLNWSVTAGSNPGLTSGDVLLVGWCGNGNTATGVTSQAVTATGVSTWGTVAERQDTSTSTGDDMAYGMSEHPVTTGTATAAPVYSHTFGGATGANTPAGPVAFLRLREVSGGTATISPTGIASGEAFGTASFSRISVAAIAPSGVASAESFGSPTFTRTSLASVTANGIASLEAFGAATFSPTYPGGVFPSGIASGEAFGSAAFVRFAVYSVSTNGIPSGEAFGTASFASSYDSTILPSGISSAETFGLPAISFRTAFSPSGIPSAEAFGTPTFSRPGSASDLTQVRFIGPRVGLRANGELIVLF